MLELANRKSPSNIATSGKNSTAMAMSSGSTQVLEKGLTKPIGELHESYAYRVGTIQRLIPSILLCNG